jgi:hypothetical protein
VVDKGIDRTDIKFGRIDTFAGSFLTGLVAVFVIIATGAVFYYLKPGSVVEDAQQTTEAITPLMPLGKGACAYALFGIGLLDVGFLGALCISSTRWVVGEVMGWARSLNKGVKDTPWFYVVYFLALVSVGAVVLIPKAPLITITMFGQIMTVTLLPAALMCFSPSFSTTDLSWGNMSTCMHRILQTGVLFSLSLLAQLYSAFLFFFLTYSVRGTCHDNSFG